MDHIICTESAPYVCSKVVCNFSYASPADYKTSPPPPDDVKSPATVLLNPDSNKFGRGGPYVSVDC